MEDKKMDKKKIIEETKQSIVSTLMEYISSMLIVVLLYASYAYLLYSGTDYVSGIIFLLPMLATSLTRSIEEEVKKTSKLLVFLHVAAFICSSLLLLLIMYQGLNNQGPGILFYATIIYPTYELIFTRIKWHFKKL